MNTTMNTTTNTLDAEALDLRPLLALRAPAAALAERLEAGDTSVVAEATHLLDVETAILNRAAALIVSLGIDDTPAQDALSEIVSQIGTGQLGYALDVALGRSL